MTLSPPIVASALMLASAALLALRSAALSREAVKVRSEQRRPGRAKSGN